MNKKSCFKTNDGYLFIHPEDINHIESEEAYAYIYCGSTKHFVHCSLKSLELILPGESFVRCHRSYLVNVDKVVKFIRAANFKLLMENGMEIPIARGKRKIVTKELGIENC